MIELCFNSKHDAVLIELDVFLIIWFAGLLNQQYIYFGYLIDNLLYRYNRWLNKNMDYMN